MKMKKILACLLAMIMVLSLAACGSDSDTNTDPDNGQQNEQTDKTDKPGQGTPLESMNFVKVPEDIVGTRWEFCGGFLNGVEMDNEQATATLKRYGGKFEVDFNAADSADFVQGGGVLSGSCGADENNDMIVLSVDNNGTKIDYTFLFADLNGTTIMVMLVGDSASNSYYFRQVIEG